MRRVLDWGVAKRGKILVAMSGGVDSSVAAAMLRDQGHEVVGVFMRLGSPGEELQTIQPDAPPEQGQSCKRPAGSSGGSVSGDQLNAPGLKIGHQGCCSINDAADARMVAAELGIPLYICNFKKDFGRIIDYFVDEYTDGRTPNPCVRCNDWLKFGKLHEYAHQLGCDAVASGHYARIGQHRGQPVLMRARDFAKDQSYVLFGIPRQQLATTLLPIGEHEDKQAVRDHAERLGLPVFDKPDSQEICFVPDQDYAGLVERKRPGAAQPGEIRDTAGKVLGEHGGQHRFTIGQRRGVGVAFGYPIYVVEKDSSTNTVTVGPAEALMSSCVEVGEVNWLVTNGPTEGQRVLAQCRAHGDSFAGTLRPLASSSEQTHSGRTGRLHLEFDTPQRAAAPGQAVVLYDPQEPSVVLGGGWIQKAQRLPL